jgi:hypothetical protein
MSTTSIQMGADTEAEIGIPETITASPDAYSELYPISSANLPTIHTSVMLRRLIDNVPPDHFTLDWLISSMPDRSYGVVVLFLALFSFIPVIGVFTRLMIMFLALQIIWGRRSPAFPRHMMVRKFSSRHLKQLPPFAFRALTRIEKSIRPRWAPLLSGRRLSGMILFLVSLVSLILPVPFANVPAAAIIALMALAYLEHDGLLLLVAQSAGIGFLALTALGIFEAVYL